MTSHRKGVKNPTPILNLHIPLSAPRLSRKYRNRRREYCGSTYASAKEAKFAAKLDLLIRAGAIKG
jgi:hypothetical protein